MKAALRSGQEVPLVTEASLAATGDPTYSRSELLVETSWAGIIGHAIATWAGTMFQDLIIGRRMRPYHSIDDLLAMLDEPNRTACARLLADHRTLFASVQGSTHNHQTWRGGYLDHVTDAMNIAVVLYEQLSALRPLPFSLSDLLLVVYLHDLEKPWKFELGPDGQLRHKAELSTKEAHQKFRMQKLAEYGVTLTVEHENGLRYAEGELADYTNQRRVMGPLAAVAHMCDVASARLWFDYPAAAGDPWVGASRVAR